MYEHEYKYGTCDFCNEHNVAVIKCLTNANICARCVEATGASDIIATNELQLDRIDAGHFMSDVYFAY